MQGKHVINFLHTRYCYMKSYTRTHILIYLSNSPLAFTYLVAYLPPFTLSDLQTLQYLQESGEPTGSYEVSPLIHEHSILPIY